MKAAMNGVPNLSILDGWWPEGCEHGVTGWKIGDADPSDDAFDEKTPPRRSTSAIATLLYKRARPRGAAGLRRSRDVARDHAREHRDVAVAVLARSDDRGLRRRLSRYAHPSARLRVRIRARHSGDRAPGGACRATRAPGSRRSARRWLRRGCGLASRAGTDDRRARRRARGSASASSSRSPSST